MPKGRNFLLPSVIFSYLNHCEFVALIICTLQELNQIFHAKLLLSAKSLGLTIQDNYILGLRFLDFSPQSNVL